MKRFTQTISLAFWIDFWMVMTTDCDLALEVIQTLNTKPLHRIIYLFNINYRQS